MQCLSEYASQASPGIQVLEVSMTRRKSMPVFRLTFLLAILLGTLAPEAMAQADVKGQWTTMSSAMTINPVHTALMHNGKILVIAGSGNCPPSQSGCPSGAPYGASNHSGATVFDPVAQTFNQLTLSWDMFCSAMTILQDGRVFVNGGTIVYDPFHGQLKSSIFDPATNTFTDVPTNMAHGRWYPTVTLLSDGRVMAFGGSDETGGTNTTVEIYTVGSGWSPAYTASWTPPLYPREHLLPNGNVFVSGPNAPTLTFNPSNQTWTSVATTKYGGTRTYGSSVLLPLTPANSYDPKVMLFGGATSATQTTEIIDLGVGSPSWVFGPDMSQARIEMDAVILPTGQVLALGGSSSDEVASTHSRNADLYDPGTNTFSSAGTNNFDRLYHSVALLLPDATVWSAGSNPTRGTWESHMEIYQPPYLFTRNGTSVVLATRPTIASAPANISWAGAFTVSTPDAANISQAVLVRPGASTHAFDMDQRLVGLSFTAGSGSLTVTGPPNSKIAPPGYYMLFLINNSGVPSVASFVLLNGSASNPAPTVASITPNTGPAAGGTSVTITGTGFLPGATVSLGGTPATGVNVVSSTSITATAPAHVAGTVSVVVSNSDAQNGTLNNAYTYTGAGGGAISFVQVNAATPQAASASVAVTYAASQTAGNLNVVAVGWNDTTSTVNTVTDSRGNTYALAIGPTSGTGLRQSIYYAKNIAAGANTVTVTFSKAAAFVDVRVLEYSGLDTASPLDKTAGAAGSGTTASSGAATTTAANELIFGAGMTAAAFTGAGSGFISRVITTPDADNAEDRSVSATGSYSATAPNSSSNWVMQMATFKASGQGGGNPAPTVTSITPTSGSANGGTAVTISGTGFLAGATVSLGGTAATNVTLASSTSITATTAAHASGAVSVVVTNTDAQTGTLANGYTYTASNPAPTVTSISPTSGGTTGSTSVTITGTGFLTGATVSFGGTAATNVNVVGSTSITATTPAHASGAVNVVVTNSDTQTGTLPNGYTYGNPAPTVTSISPTTGATTGSTSVTITGTGFLTGATVSFGGTAATNVTVVGATSITATTPAHAAGAVSVVVTNTDTQTGTLPNGFTYGSPAPTVTSITPSSGTANGSSSVTITGTGFVTGATVTMGGTAATNVIVVSATSITATTPAHAAGAVDVVVTNTDAQAGTLVNGYTYTSSNPAPTVTSIAPNTGSSAGGISVTITGTGFLTGATVSLGGTAATNVTVVGPTSITATTPAHAAGAVNVTVTNTDAQAGTLPSGYTYTNPAPTVGSITPNTGTANGGTAVTINGTGFLPGVTVSLGGTAATNVNLVGNTSITATTPAHAAGGVTVTVTNSDAQSASLINGYTYTASNPAPTVSSITPNSGPVAGGITVTITGTGFLAGATVSLGGTAATGVNVASSTSITATTPAHVAGAVTVTVTNSDAQNGSLTNGYTYRNPAPTVTSITPNSGSSAGGNSVTITGTGFTAGATVSLGGTAATGVSVVSGTSITATAPAHAAGAVNVVVTNSDTQSGTLTNGYTYTTSTGGGPITFVQVKAATPQSNTASVAVTYPVAQTLGNLNIVAVGWNDTTSTVTGITDTRGNTYSLAIGPTTGTGLRQSIYYARNIAAGSNTVTVTFSKAAAFVDIRALEYSGLDPANPLDQAAGAVGSGTTASSGAVTTSAANELIFGAGMTLAVFTGPGSGFTSRIITSPDADIAEDRTVTTTGSYSATAPNTTSSWVMQVATFQKAP